MDSLYKDGNDWKLNGGTVPAGKYRLSIVDNYVALLGAETADRIDEYTLVTTISKNVGGDKYADFDEFYEATKLFFTKSQITSGYFVLPEQSTGRLPGTKYGVNVSIATGPEDVWETGGAYPFDADGTAPIISLISDNNNDTEVIRIRGLDIDGNRVFQNITLTGTTRVALTTPLWRVNRMTNEGTTSLQGTVYCYTGTSTGGAPALGTRRATIDNGNNKTLMAIDTIPKGKVGFLYRAEAGIELSGSVVVLADYARVRLQTRRIGKVPKVQKEVSIMVSQGSYKDKREFPDPISALTDIWICVHQVSTAMGAWATFEIELVDESKFSDEWLAALGQPGY
jgi:hypothetical protein